MRLNNISVTKKFGMLTVSAFLAIFLISALQLMTYRQTMMEDRKAKTQNVVELAHSMTLDFMAQYKKGLLTEAQAKEEALSVIRAMRYDGDNYFWINDMQPRMVMHPMKPELVGADLSKNADPNGKFLFNEMVDIVKKQGSGFVDYMWPKPGFDEPVGKLSYVAGVPEWGWVIGSGIYIDDVQTAFMQSMKATALIAGGVFFLLFCSSWLISRSITLPLTRLSGNMGTLAEGRSITIEDHQRGDEIGTMAKALQYLDIKLQEAKKLEEQQRELEKRAEQESSEQEKKESIRRMADAFEEKVGGLIYSLASASSELQTTAQDMRNVADTTAQNSQMGAAASEQVRANVSSVATAMEEMAASSSEITAQINHTRVRSNDTAHNAGKANDTVTDLNVLVGDIGEVVAAIRDIAEQTNLLALNATIEAARAGESGKGFAVVADEVKKLATETSKKTGEIEAQINGIQQATSSSVIAMQQIIANISEIDQAITTVSSAAEEQNATNNEISRSITEASMGVQNVAQIIIEVQSGSDNTGASADAVLTAASELAELSEQLRTSLDVFLKDMRAG